MKKNIFSNISSKLIVGAIAAYIAKHDIWILCKNKFSTSGCRRVFLYLRQPQTILLIDKERFSVTKSRNNQNNY